MSLFAIVNCGSSSIKVRLLDPESGRSPLAGAIDGIGTGAARMALHQTGAQAGAATKTDTAVAAPDHRAGLDLLLEAVLASEGLAEAGGLACIGHRVVHGGEAFTAPARVTADVLAAIRAQVPLAPLHNPANIAGIEAAMALVPEVPQVAVFDTAFHQTLPPAAYRYALPEALYSEHKVRRYGFHGSSHAYVSRAAAAFLGRPLDRFNAVVLHLGNGASAAAIRGGQSVETSMGMTPLEGLVMGTRAGDTDPALAAYLARAAGLSVGAVDALLNREAGLKGLCGDSDMRRVEARMAAGDPAARLAFEVFCHRARKYLGAYMAVLGRVDAVIFTAGIGENSAAVRAAIVAGLEPFGIALDPARNQGRAGPREIGTEAAAVRLLVIPTEEELEIAREARDCLARERAGPDGLGEGARGP